MVAATPSPITPRTAPIQAAADRPSTPRTSGLYGWATASAGTSTTSLTTPMQSWIGSIVPTNCRIRTGSGTPRPASPAIATNTTVTSSDGPGCPRKTSERIRPPGDRSSHHAGRGGLFLGRISGGFVGCGLVAIAKLVLGVDGRFRGLPRGGQGPVPSCLLGRDLRGEQAVVQGVLEAADPALGVLRRVIGAGVSVTFSLISPCSHLVAAAPEVWSLIDELPETIVVMTPTGRAVC